MIRMGFLCICYVFLFAVLASGQTTTTTASIVSSGPLTTVAIGSTLNCAVNHVGDSSGEFFGDTACGTFVATSVSGNATLFGPLNTPAGGGLGVVTEYTQFSQSPVTGSGTVGDPFKVVTSVGMLDTTLSMVQTDTYVVGQEVYRTDLVLTNNGSVPVTATVFHGADCYLQSNDNGFGLYDSRTGAISCRGVDPTNTSQPGNRLESFVPLTSGSQYLEAYYNDMWLAIGAKVPFNNTCVCAVLVDNAAALSWNVVVPANGSISISLLTLISPLGAVTLAVNKTTMQSPVPAGGLANFSMSVSNPGTTDQSLLSIIDTMPTGFTYAASSTTGVTTADPSVSGQQITWNGPFTIPAGGQVTIQFSLIAPQVGGTYNNTGSAVSSSGLPVIAGTSSIIVSDPTTTSTLTTSTTTTSPTTSTTTSPTTSTTTTITSTTTSTSTTSPTNCIDLYSQCSPNGSSNCCFGGRCARHSNSCSSPFSDSFLCVPSTTTRKR